jgi:hypothetical protein
MGTYKFSRRVDGDKESFLDGKFSIASRGDGDKEPFLDGKFSIAISTTDSI